MAVDIWLNQSYQLIAGAELYCSPRSFRVWSYDPTFGRLLLRNTPSPQGRHDGIRVDIMFQSVRAMKLRDNYQGLRITCATQDERERIRTESPQTTHLSTFRDDHRDRFLVLQSGAGFDYVVAGAVGWREDRAPLGWPSSFVAPVPTPSVR
ncbi:hypothetical protein ACFROC_05450 [Nocardia tengchongensis]|uniref:hypothetical protein n=1 Tax=Nocardia tengchongensis TaxID=2055889 RepID=UPI0036A5B4CD